MVIQFQIRLIAVEIFAIVGTNIRPVLKLLKKKQRSDRIVTGDEKWIIKKG